MNARKIIHILAVLFLFTESTSAQIGFKTSLVSPNGDIGQFYNKGVAADLFIVTKDDNGPWRERAGLFYTKLSSRIDTVPVYAVQSGANISGGNGGTVVLPGYLVNHYFSMFYLYIDIGYRVLRVKNLSLYVGAGMQGGISHLQYDRGFETLLVETADNEVKIAGYRLTANLEYRINSHFEVLLETVANRMVTLDWATHYEHNTLSAGVDYYFKARRQQRKHKHTK